MIKPKQPVQKSKLPTTRKPSLPIKRASSAQSNISDQSCMSDRIIYKKYTIQEPNIRQIQPSQSKKNLSNNFQQQKSSSSINPSDKNIKKLKNKLNMNQTETNKKIQHSLTGFQWLIIMRHCFHIQNKRRSTNSIKQRTLMNYIKNRMYPDSLWNKILVIQNQHKFTVNQIIATIQKQIKWKLTLDDILVCMGKNYSQDNLQQVDESESAAQTARFTQNMKPNIQHKSGKNITQNQYSQPKFIYKQHSQSKNNTQKAHISSSISSQHQKPKKQQIAAKQIQPMNTTNMNTFPIQQQLGLNISPISVVSGIDQTNNDISFSMQQSQSQIQSNYQSQTNFQSQTGQQSTLGESQSFQYGFNGIQALKKNLQIASKNNEQKMLLVNFLQEILSYSIYKNKRNRSGRQNKIVKNQIRIQLQGMRKNSASYNTNSDKNDSLETTQYFHGLKLQSRKNISKISPQILQRLFSSTQFTSYFHNLQAIKISQYQTKLLTLPLPILSSSLRILNLSHNNLLSLSFLKDLEPHNLQFINLSNNKITNMSELLSLNKLQQIHIKHNLIDHVHVSKDKINAKNLKIIDLGYNHIQKQQDLWSLNQLPSLKMINLAGNTILKQFKSIGVLSKEIILDHVEMYVFSAYTQYKDVAFSTKPKQNRETNIGNGQSGESRNKQFVLQQKHQRSR